MTEFMLMSFVVLAILVGGYADIAMKIQVNDRLPEKERFSWWTRNSWAVARKYGEFYPDSNLPVIGQLSFWICIALGAALLVITLRESS